MKDLKRRFVKLFLPKHLLSLELHVPGNTYDPLKPVWNLEKHTLNIFEIKMIECAIQNKVEGVLTIKVTVRVLLGNFLLFKICISTERSPGTFSIFYL